jgi:hypothetical protein
MERIEINKYLLTQINSITYDKRIKSIAIISDNFIAIRNFESIDIVNL